MKKETQSNEQEVQLRQLEKISSFINLSGKKILEIGCGNGDMLKLMAERYDIEYVIGIDMNLSSWWNADESKGANWEVRDGDAENLSFDDNTFDAVVSIATFEHIYDVEKALSEIKRVLKPFGRFYTTFWPIWTSVVGHHWSTFDANGNYWNDEYMKLIPPWGHLYMNEAEMREHVQKQINSSLVVEEMANFIYKSSIINRRSKKYLRDAIMNSGMVVRHYAEYVNFSRKAYTGGGESELTEDIIKKISAAGYDAADIGVHGMSICLEKYNELT